MKKIRAGVCGIGRIATDDHIPMLKRVEGFDLISACDITPARRIYAAYTYGLKAYSDYDRFLDSGVDMVVISAPSNMHKEHALKAIAKGKHIVVEKPCAINARDTKAIIDAARRKGVMMTVYHNRRWDGDFLTVKKIMDGGLIGKPFSIESRVIGYGNLLWYAVKEFDSAWRYKKHYGGGVLLDFGTHLVDQILQLVKNKPVSVWCKIAGGVWTHEVEDYFKCLIRFDSGMTAQLETSQISRYGLPRWHVSGTKGAILCQDWFSGPVHVKYSKDKTKEGKETALNRVKPAGKDIFYNNIRDVLLKKAKLIVKPEEVYRVMVILDAARESAKLKKEVAIKF